MKKTLFRILKFLGAVILLFVIGGGAFLLFSPQFGGSVPDTQQEFFTSIAHYKEGKFINKEPIVFEVNCHSVEKMVMDMTHPSPNLAPQKDLEVLKVAPEDILSHSDTSIQVIWFGHSTFLLKIQGEIILLDPVFSDYAAPNSMLGRKRYNSEMPIEIEDLPEVDLVVISHDHYDHLDYESIVKLKDKTSRFMVGLGVGNHLKSWGVDENKVTEMDWWQEEELGEIKVTFVPSRHTSGRGIGDQDATLWGGWIFQGATKSAFYSGDGGYGTHFKEIGAKYGPFDLGIMECGQYNDLWKDMHMVPEETAKAGLDVQAKSIVAAHWGAFSLAMHSWKEPIQRVTKEANRLGLPIATPRIGEAFSVGAGPLPSDTWWEEIE